MSNQLLLLLVLPLLVLSDYITNDFNGELYRVSEQGVLSPLATIDSDTQYTSAIFQAPNMYYALGQGLYSCNISSKESHVTPFPKSEGLTVMCQSPKTSTIYSFNISTANHEISYSLVSLATDGTPRYLANLSFNYGEYFQQCVVDDATNAIYWIVGQGSSIALNVLMTDLKTYATRVLYQVERDDLAINLGADGNLYVIQSNTSTSTLSLATIPTTGKATLQPFSTISRITEVPIMVGPTNLNTNAAVFFGFKMYVWSLANGSALKTVPFSTSAYLNTFTAVWI